MQLPWLQPTPGTMGEGLSGVGDAFMQVAQAKRQRDQQAAEMLLRQKVADREEARLQEQERHTRELEQAQAQKAAGEEHVKIADLYKRDPHLAASYLNAIGAKNVGLDPVYEGGSAPPTPPPPPAGPTPSALAGPPPMQPSNDPEAEARPPTPGPPTPVQPPPMAQAAPAMATPPPAPHQELGQHLLTSPDRAAQAANAVDSLKQAREAQQQQGSLIGHRLRYTLADGHETVIDPLEQKQIRDSEAADQIKNLDFAGLPPKYKMIVAARLKGGADQNKAYQGIFEAMKADEERAFKEQQASKYQTTAEQKYRIGMSNAQAHKMSAEAGAGSKEDAAAVRAQGQAERTSNDIDKLVNWKDLQTMDNKTRLALGELSTDHALPERDAKVLAASIFRGGVPTGGEMHELYSNLGGTADAWERFKSNVLRGRLDNLQREQLKQSLSTAADVVAERKGRALKTLQTRFGPGSGYEVMGPQINAIIKSHAVQAGVDDFPDLYDEQQTGPGAVLLGSRKKKSAGAGAAPQAKASNPLVKAARTAGMPSDMAAWVDANPGTKADDIVAKWNKENGVRP